ncbi:MAG: hypothetical protein HC772_16600 [Leptolyngbyaceae cyanobacterium CRU_2_3]|nr:hypothetical protein [Leptolyngbyaceae cyanobacterium CRU_2_3]
MKIPTTGGEWLKVSGLLLGVVVVGAIVWNTVATIQPSKTPEQKEMEEAIERLEQIQKGK